MAHFNKSSEAMKKTGHKYCEAMHSVCYSLATEDLNIIKNDALRDVTDHIFPRGIQDDALLFILDVFNNLQEEQTPEPSKFNSKYYKYYEKALDGYKSNYSSITDELFT